MKRTNSAMRPATISGALMLFAVILFAVMLTTIACSKGGGNDSGPDPVTPPASFSFNSLQVNGTYTGFTYTGVNTTPVLRLGFSTRVTQQSVSTTYSLKDATGTVIPFTSTLENNDSLVVIRPSSPLAFLTKYTLTVPVSFQSAEGGNLLSPITVNLFTRLDSSRKFPQITDDELLTKVQQQTFRYFWDFGHPVSGLARERSNGDNEVVTSGGSGFGIMAIVTGIHRGFITRAEGLTRLQTMVGFLKNTAVKVKGAFPHWLNGTTGAIVPFSANDNGADLVETSYLMQGLLTARQFFDGSDASEASLRADINTLWNGVDWNWFRQNDQNVLYWHYRTNPGSEWIMNVQIRGWNECLITYVLGASSTTHAIPRRVYDNGWANNGGILNGNSFYGYRLPLGPDRGGPLFFSHYSFLGIKPLGLSDAYADYDEQVTNHTLINYNYCRANPMNWYGYSDSVWGLTASDIPNGYMASSPSNDVGVIAPTAALSSFPYTPAQSMAALRFYYYVLGDKIFRDYGFVDAFSLKEPWFANSFLAIDQGPIIVMIENYRSRLLWDLFTSAPEVKAGMISLGFSAPYL